MELGKHAVKRLFGSLDARFRDEAGAPTGIASVDAAGGLRAAEVTVLAGHPGVGKTSMATSMAIHTLRNGGALLWFTLAETAEQMAERMLVHESCVRAQAVRLGKLERAEMTSLTYAAATISKWPLHVEDCIDLTAAMIRERAREWREQVTATRALVVVDYLQLLADECDAGAVLRSLLGTAKQSRAALLLVSQQLSDARERAALESIATAVIYLRAEVHTHEILLAKHRYCQTPQTEEVLFEGSTFATPAATT